MMDFNPKAFTEPVEKKINEYELSFFKQIPLKVLYVLKLKLVDLRNFLNLLEFFFRVLKNILFVLHVRDNESIFRFIIFEPSFPNIGCIYTFEKMYCILLISLIDFKPVIFIDCFCFPRIEK